MFDPERLLGQMISGSFGGLGRKVSDTNRSLSQMGGMGGFGGGAKLGMGLGLLGVAVAAFEHFKGDKPPSAAPNAMPPPPPMAPPPPLAPQGRSVTEQLPEEFQSVSAPNPAAHVLTAPAASSPALHLLRSMIAAAHADGVLDPQEREAIVGRAREAGLPADDLMALGAELQSPQSLQQLAQSTPDGLQRETYAAALLAIRVDNSAEQQHLDRLAAALRLSDQDRQLIHQQLGAG